jgi:hypothetical protein
LDLRFDGGFHAGSATAKTNDEPAVDIRGAFLAIRISVGID